MQLHALAVHSVYLVLKQACWKLKLQLWIFGLTAAAMPPSLPPIASPHGPDWLPCLSKTARCAMKSLDAGPAQDLNLHFLVLPQFWTDPDIHLGFHQDDPACE
jgi:hypothetical protein